MRQDVIPRISGVYEIVSPNGRRYIGQSTNIARRFAVHRCLLRKGNHHSRALQADWNALGESAFKIEITPANLSDLTAIEGSKIDALPDILKYNKHRSKRDPGGRYKTAITRAKIGAAHKGRVVSDVVRLRISKSLKGREFSDELRRKISTARRNMTPAQRAALVERIIRLNKSRSKRGV